MRERKRRNFNQSSRSGFSLGPFANLIVMILIVGSLAAVISLQRGREHEIFSNNDKKEKKIAELMEEKERLMVEATRLQSIQEIQKEKQESGINTEMIPVQKINFLPTTNVALK